jgi:predicted transcriptional regulator
MRHMKFERVKANVISVRLDDEIKAAAEKAAEADARTLSSLIQKALTEYLRRNGFLRSPK